MQSLKLALNDRMALYECYMPFVRHGGLFIPTDTELRLGDTVGVSIEFMQEREPLQVTGVVVWLTPPGAQGNRNAGAGIGLGKDGETIRCKIENHLAGAGASERRTHTL